MGREEVRRDVLGLTGECEAWLRRRDEGNLVRAALAYSRWYEYSFSLISCVFVATYTRLNNTADRPFKELL